VRVVNVTGVTSIGAGSNRTFAVRSDGTVWGWGDKSDGMLGNGEDCQQCATGTPVQVSALTNARAVHTERYGGYAVDADGRVWAWGRNYSDRLGPVEGTMPPANGYTTVPMRLSKPTGATAVSGGSWASGSVLVP
jgi:alpha-tubulin suppressor-like RCC1 family protein